MNNLRGCTCTFHYIFFIDISRAQIHLLITPASGANLCAGATSVCPRLTPPAHTHLFEELGVDVDAGVDGGRQRLDGPRRVHRVDLHVKRIQLLGREHVVPGGAQLEQGLSSVFVHLQTEDSAWSKATNRKPTSHCAQLLVHFKTSAKVLKPPSSFH